MKVGYLVIGRLKSTRLPKKLLLKIKGKPVLEHMIDRLKIAKNIDNIVICTSYDEMDKPLIKFAEEQNICSYAGHPDDVLARMLGASEKFGFDYILTITADCPLVDPFYADKVVNKFLESNADLIRQFDLPHGAFSYGIKVSALKKVIGLKNTQDTEVWGRYFTDTGLFDVLDMEIDSFHKRPGLRMTLDYPEDLDFLSVIFDELYEKNNFFTLDQILSLLDLKPEIIEINKNCGKKFKKRFDSQSEPKLKKQFKVASAVIIGCGSIGQRHVRNLKKIGINSIIALRSHKGHYQELPEDIDIIEVNELEEVRSYKPEIAIISNPTSMHIEAVKKIVPYVKGVFIEKPISDSSFGVNELDKLLLKNNVVSFVGYNLMFHPILEVIKTFVDNEDVGSIINFQCQAGQWLPDWHPYEDFKKAYYSNKDLGGGVSLTLIHEIHLALELAGLPKEVIGIISPSESLDIDVDVQSDLMIKHRDGAVSQIHLDYLQRPYHRNGLISFERGWLSYDFSQMQVIAQTHTDKKPLVIWSNLDYDNNLMYIKQMEKFIQYVEERRFKHKFDLSPASSSLGSLKVVEALFDSEKKKSIVNIIDNQRFSF